MFRREADEPCGTEKAPSDRAERSVRLGREGDLDRVARADRPAADMSTAITSALRSSPPAESRSRTAFKARPEAVELRARVAQAGDLDRRSPADQQPDPGPKPSRPRPRVVMFSPISPGATPNPNRSSSPSSSAWIRWTCRKVRRGRVTSDAEPVPHGAPAVSVAFDPEAGDEPDRRGPACRTRVPRAG